MTFIDRLFCLSAGCSSRQQFVWLRGQRMCIKVHTARANFSTAYSSCRKVASRLVVLDTRDKLRAFMAYMADQSKSSSSSSSSLPLQPEDLLS